jgi:colanic acid/amylovoran biosynthesis glycosyltransferase
MRRPSPDPGALERPRPAPAGPRVGYVLKMFPRFSETFILNEVLELERQGMDLRIFSLKQPDEGVVHADVARVRAPVTYVPESLLRATLAYAAAHREVFRRNRPRYLRCLSIALWRALKKRRLGALKRFLQAGFLAPLLRRERIGHVHAHFATSATAVALHLHDLTGVSYSFTAHAKDIFRHTVESDSLERKLRASRFAVTVSDYNRRYLADFEGSERVVRIYNGLEIDRYAPNGAAREQPPLVLAVGRLVEKKGFADLIRACALLRESGPAFQCLIVGKGELEGELRRLIEELGLGGQVELAGPIPRERLLSVYRRASVVVAPCVIGSDGNRDGLPTVVAEAMAIGVPVVATDVTGIPELVKDGRTGVLVPQRQPEALATAIGRVLADPAWAGALARAGRARVERDFDLRVNVARLRGLLDEARTA